MKQTNYWMWSKRKQNFGNPNLCADSWEEQAFAEDASGQLGGCVWPPRSYSCSFCRREFLSAQALGGHMNVHRRDRARLKQSPNPSRSEVLHHHVLTPCTSLDPNPIYQESDRVVFASPSLASRIFSPTPLLQENRDERVVLPIFSSPNIENHGSERSPSSRLNVARRFHQTCDKAMSCKRRRTTDSNSCGGNTHLHESEVLELISSTSTEEEEEVEVDLELRLGGRPEVE